MKFQAFWLFFLLKTSLFKLFPVKASLFKLFPLNATPVFFFGQSLSAGERVKRRNSQPFSLWSSPVTRSPVTITRDLALLVMILKKRSLVVLQRIRPSPDMATPNPPTTVPATAVPATSTTSTATTTTVPIPTPGTTTAKDTSTTVTKDTKTPSQNPFDSNRFRLFPTVPETRCYFSLVNYCSLVSLLVLQNLEKWLDYLLILTETAPSSDVTEFCLVDKTNGPFNPVLVEYSWFIGKLNLGESAMVDSEDLHGCKIYKVDVIALKIADYRI